MKMTADTPINVALMADDELAAFVEAGKAELAAREKRRKDDAISKIPAMAGAAGLSVFIEGTRGRPAKKRPSRIRSVEKTAQERPL